MALNTLAAQADADAILKKEEHKQTVKDALKAQGANGINAYVPQNGEVDELERAINAGVHTLLTGPTGCGKTHLAYHVAAKMGREIIELPSGSGATYERIIAKDALKEVNGVTVTVRPSANAPETWSILPKAMAQGAICYSDEPNTIPPEVLFCLFSSMDNRASITFDDGSVLKAKEGFVVIGAMNEGAGYTGTTMLNSAFRRRTANIIDMEYLPRDRETAMLVARTGVDKALAWQLTKLAQGLRNALSGKTMKTPIDTGSLLACCKLIVAGADIQSAVKNTIVNRAPSTSAERKSISDVVAAHFGKAVQ